MAEVKNLWATDADDSSLQSKSGGKFGLNTGNITLFEYTDKAGKDSSEGHAVDIHFTVGDREYRRRLYFNVGGEVFAGDKRLKPGEEGYDDAFGADLVQKIALIKQALESVGVTKEAIAAVAATLSPDFKDTIENAKKMLSLVPADYTKKSVDGFLEYQWSIREGSDRTFLELPGNCKGGRVLVPAQAPVGKWTEVRSEEEGLHYVDDAGNKHPFSRNENYMKSNRAIPQGAGYENVNSSTVTPAQTAQKSTWD